MNPSLDWLRQVALELGDLREEVVFLGGAIAGLLVTEATAFGVRPTDDVDVIIETATVTAEFALRERLRGLGFREDTREDAPICRWIIESICVDIMPTTSAALGFLQSLVPGGVRASNGTPARRRDNRPRDHGALLHRNQARGLRRPWQQQTANSTPLRGLATARTPTPGTRPRRLRRRRRPSMCSGRSSRYSSLATAIVPDWRSRRSCQPASMIGVRGWPPSFGGDVSGMVENYDGETIAAVAPDLRLGVLEEFRLEHATRDVAVRAYDLAMARYLTDHPKKRGKPEADLTPAARDLRSLPVDCLGWKVRVTRAELDRLEHLADEGGSTRRSWFILGMGRDAQDSLELAETGTTTARRGASVCGFLRDVGASFECR